MNSITALKWRYAVKKFDPDKLVSEEKIDVLKTAFNLTATSYGLQPLRLVLVQNKEIQDKLMKASYNQKQIGTASHLLVICIENTVDKGFIEKHFKMVQDIRKTPDEILHPFRESLIGDFEQKPVDEVKIWATHQAYLVLGTLLTVCAVEGIDSCPMEGFEPKKYNEILELEKYGLEAVLALPVGYRSDDDFFASLKKVRRPLKDTVIEI
ncbi:NAD(P)H-dependent oxidoreductase [Salinimicrobium sediminilitoris]|uniref:NAD(P)H-dependent oxidoreductase n=1 Tax=Salinimicrobium sediminilitoris TaxID=2876715 RepID=UPI001E468A60|nr:NAD(P)H-dependent oxidoreductase [Salinimicrobium sediminilitoris]MCC8358883.1 NAD(P)H-dependent oxidoreductase [Salinimicrobium sediminilitoris]